MTALRACTVPGCPALVPKGKSRCDPHTREKDAERGTSTERGYGYRHQKLRAHWGRLIRVGTPVICPRCGLPIKQGMAWDLGHTDDRAGYLGPEHATCNRSAAGRARGDSDR